MGLKRKFDFDLLTRFDQRLIHFFVKDQCVRFLLRSTLVLFFWTLISDNPVLGLLVDAKSGSLLETFLASLEIAGVWSRVGVGIQMFFKVLVLGKITTTQFAHKAFKTHVVDYQVSP